MCQGSGPDVLVGHALQEHLENYLVPVGDLGVAMFSGAGDTQLAQVSLASDPDCKSSGCLDGLRGHPPQVDHVNGLVELDDGQLFHFLKEESTEAATVVDSLQQVLVTRGSELFNLL